MAKWIAPAANDVDATATQRKDVGTELRPAGGDGGGTCSTPAVGLPVVRAVLAMERSA
jgi:hypothetical protein